MQGRGRCETHMWRHSSLEVQIRRERGSWERETPDIGTA